MFVNELFTEAEARQLVVLYPGRFQPFHLGHRDVFASLQSKFGRDSVFIATSNKSELPKSPFNFSEKVAFMNAAGVHSDRILQVTNPYKLPEQFDDSNTIFVVAVGAPDADRLKPDSLKKDGSPAYYKTFKSIEDCETADKHGYVIVAAERNKVITLDGQQVDVSHGTSSRNAWNMVRNDTEGRSEYLKQMFGRDDPELGRLLDKIPVNEDSNMPVAKDSSSAIPGISVLETIRKVKGGYRLVSHTGKNLGTYPTHAGAEKRERQVQYFKHAGESVGEGYNDEEQPIKHDQPVEAYGYAYNNRDQRVMWRKVFSSGEAAYKWADQRNATILGTRPHTQMAEDAAGVGVVKNSNDPRYVMATMGDQNDVTAQTLPNEMKAYGLIGRKMSKSQKLKVAESLLNQIRALREDLEQARQRIAKNKKQ